MPKIVGVENGSQSGRDKVEQKKGITYRVKEFDITYLVLADDLFQDDEDMYATPGIPPLYYPSFGALCKSREAKEETRIIHPVTGAAAALWLVTCHFDTNLSDDEEQQEPTSQRPRVSWSGDNEDEPIAKNVSTGEPIVNACNEPLFVTRPSVRPIISIKRFETYPFDPTVMLDYANTVNSEPFWGAPTGCALMLPMDVSEETIIDKVRYVEVTYRIKFNLKRDPDTGDLIEDMWRAEVLHQGQMYRPSAGAAPIIARKQGQPVTVNLKEDGTKLPDGDDLIYLYFDKFDLADFNALSLGPF